MVILASTIREIVKIWLSTVHRFHSSIWVLLRRKEQSGNNSSNRGVWNLEHQELQTPSLLCYQNNMQMTIKMRKSVQKVRFPQPRHESNSFPAPREINIWKHRKRECFTSFYSFNLYKPSATLSSSAQGL